MKWTIKIIIQIKYTMRIPETLISMVLTYLTILASEEEKEEIHRVNNTFQKMFWLKVHGHLNQLA